MDNKENKMENQKLGGLLSEIFKDTEIRKHGEIGYAYGDLVDSFKKFKITNKLSSVIEALEDVVIATSKMTATKTAKNGQRIHCTTQSLNFLKSENYKNLQNLIVYLKGL